MNRRMDRVNMLVRQEISRILVNVEINDPRLSSLISITEVQTSRDLRSAKVYFSVLGDESIRSRVCHTRGTRKRGRVHSPNDEA